MYRLVLYYLIGLFLAAFGLSLFHKLNLNPFSLSVSTGYLVVACLISNWVFAKVFEAATNQESAYITALILALILTPLHTPHDALFLGWAATLAMASKYILAYRKKHIFNPAAISAVVIAFALGRSATWWVGTAVMLPFVLAGGVLIARKLRRFDLIVTFLVVATLTMTVFGFFTHANLTLNLRQLALQSPIFFFAFVMLTEPLTLPPTKTGIAWYGALVGALFPPQLHIGTIYLTPELALVSGNIFSYIISPKYKLLPKLSQKLRLAPDVADFVFTTEHHINFKPGQYMEFTLPHDSPDDRGNRRYFTLANSPTENNLRLGIKFYPKSSSYKQAMLKMDEKSVFAAGQLAGDFTMPKDPAQKLAFIAGGIGVTPYRSMLKYLVDTNEGRDIALFYSEKTAQEFVYTDVFKTAAEKLGTKLIYTVTDYDPNWTGHKGYIDEELIKQYLPDFQERLFYISGSHSLVTSMKTMLHGLGVKHSQIKTDFFPGYV